MYKVIIIGAGQLGSRHLQGALQSKYPLEIHVVDPSEHSLEVAQLRAEEITVASKTTSVRYDQQLPSGHHFDICIVATSASVRAVVTEQLLERNTVDNIIFEKVLFQTIPEYENTQKLLKERGVRAWVNCPRRLYPTYVKLKQVLEGVERIEMSVSGSSWGMACNSIHFIDLFAFLVSSSKAELTQNCLHEQLVESKRQGFYELNGRATFKIAQNNLYLECSKDETVAIQVRIKTESNTIVIDEIAGTISHDFDAASLPRKHSPLYQSQLTGLNIDELISTSNLSLTPFEDSCALHLPMLNLYMSHISKQLGKELSACPIT